eukprot:5995244-Pleurochrysis_carterae.AAC.2
MPELEAIGNHPPTGSKGLDACGLQVIKPGGRPFRCLWAYRAGGPGATPAPARHVRPAHSPPIRPINHSSPNPPERKPLKGVAGGENLISRIYVIQRKRHIYPLIRRISVIL